jgi:ABC-type Fe3+-siderophore transport system permease subunit
MFNVLTGLALGIVIFAITVGVGSVVLSKFAGAVAECGTGYTYNQNDTTIFSTNTCCLSNGSENAACVGGTNTTPASSASGTTESLLTELGTTGLAGWAAAIIALAVGLLFIGALMGKNKY